MQFNDLNVNDYALICGKCIFNNENMYAMLSAADTFVFALFAWNINNSKHRLEMCLSYSKNFGQNSVTRMDGYKSFT